MAWSALSLLALLAAGAAMAAKTITTTSSMSFGRFVAAGAGTVKVGFTSARSASGGVILLPSQAGAAAFTISGHDNKITILTLPPNGSVFLYAGANRMPVNDFSSSLPGNGVLLPGTQTVSVGATLQVAPNQTRGSYNGVFHVTVEFQ